MLWRNLTRVLLDALLCIIQGGREGREGEESQEPGSEQLDSETREGTCSHHPPLPQPQITINWARAREQRGVRLVKTIYEKPSYGRFFVRVVGGGGRPIIEIDG